VNVRRLFSLCYIKLMQTLLCLQVKRGLVTHGAFVINQMPDELPGC